MSILSKVMLILSLIMVSAANANVACRKHNGTAIYEMSEANGVYTLTAVKAQIKMEKVLEELNIEKMLEDEILSDDDIDLLGEKIGDMGLENRGFEKGDIMTVEKVANGTKVTLTLHDGTTETLVLSASVYKAIVDELSSKTTPGKC